MKIGRVGRQIQRVVMKGYRPAWDWMKSKEIFSHRHWSHVNALITKKMVLTRLGQYLLDWGV